MMWIFSITGLIFLLLLVFAAGYVKGYHSGISDRTELGDDKIPFIQRLRHGRK